MSANTQAHQGFDVATTDDGDLVPTKHDRDLARDLRDLRWVQRVAWSGTYGQIRVKTSLVDPVLRTAISHITARPADASVRRVMRADSLREVIITPER